MMLDFFHQIKVSTKQYSIINWY